MQPNQQSGTTELKLVDNPDNRTLYTLIEELHMRVEDAKERAAAAEKRVEELEERVSEVEHENEELRELIATTRRDMATVRGDVHDLQDESASTTGLKTPDQPDTPDKPEPETSLEQVIMMPDEMAESQLTQNQQRARDVASDVEQYADSVPAGRALSASVLRRVLSAHSGGDRIHGETLRRVREFLDRLGGDAVTIEETRGGETTVVFDESMVRRIKSQAENHGVVSRGGMDGGVGV
jgi:DNA repair exonuclease SbcCD ATPase subunit